MNTFEIIQRNQRTNWSFSLSMKTRSKPLYWLQRIRNTVTAFLTEEICDAIASRISKCRRKNCQICSSTQTLPRFVDILRNDVVLRYSVHVLVSLRARTTVQTRVTWREKALEDLESSAESDCSDWRVAWIQRRYMILWTFGIVYSLFVQRASDFVWILVLCVLGSTLQPC